MGDVVSKDVPYSELKLMETQVELGHILAKCFKDRHRGIAHPVTYLCDVCAIEYMTCLHNEIANLTNIRYKYNNGGFDEE